MNKPTTLLANKGLRNAEDEDQSAFGNPTNFDPMSVLSNTKVEQDLTAAAEPPIEEVLMARTLWPESQKLYGHAFEVRKICDASSRSRMAWSATSSWLTNRSTSP